MKIRLTLLTAGLLMAPGLFAQKVEINLNRLIPLAKEHVVVDLTGDQIRAALGSRLKDSAKGQRLEAKLAGVESVHVRVFEFANANAYSQTDIEPIRKQLQAPGWSKVISVKDEGETVEVHMLTRDAKTAGFTVLVAEPKELTVVNLVGTISLSDLQGFANSGINVDVLAMMKASTSK